MFIYKGREYPILVQDATQESNEIQLVIIPEVSGDYFLAKIDSNGGYNLLEMIPFDEVHINT